MMFVYTIMYGKDIDELKKKTLSKKKKLSITKDRSQNVGLK